MIRHWRKYGGWLALLLALTACPADPPEIIVATATGQPDNGQTPAEFDPYSRDNPVPAFSTVDDGALRLTLLAFARASEAGDGVTTDSGPPGTDLAALDLRIECLEGDGHCNLVISEFQLLSGDDRFLPLEDLASGQTLVPGLMQQGDVQQTTLYFYLPNDRHDLVFRYDPFEDLWVSTIYMALPE